MSNKKEPIKLTQHEYNNIETIEALIDSHNEKKLAEYELNKSTGEVQKVDIKKLIEAHNGH